MVNSARIAAASAEKLNKVRAAQRAGKVNSQTPAGHPIMLVGRLATAQVNDPVLRVAARKPLQKSLVDAVRRLTAP
jgi:hypothetical protein